MSEESEEIYPIDDRRHPFHGERWKTWGVFCVERGCQRTAGNPWYPDLCSSCAAKRVLYQEAAAKMLAQRMAEKPPPALKLNRCPVCDGCNPGENPPSECEWCGSAMNLDSFLEFEDEEPPGE